MKTKDQLIKLGLEEFKADEIMLLQTKMREQAIRFMFKKKDGTVRDAFGTLVRERMKQADGTLWEPKGESKPEPDNVIRYFDLDKGMWRCFTVTDFLGIAAL